LLIEFLEKINKEKTQKNNNNSYDNLYGIVVQPWYRFKGTSQITDK